MYNKTVLQIEKQTNQNTPSKPLRESVHNVIANTIITNIYVSTQSQSIIVTSKCCHANCLYYSCSMTD